MKGQPPPTGSAAQQPPTRVCDTGAPEPPSSATRSRRRTVDEALHLAPRGFRVAAFVVDLLLIAAAAAMLVAGDITSSGSAVVAGLLLFVVYHSTSLWLTGQTLGKALFNLEVVRVGGRTNRSLSWSVGRSSFGYLVVDCFGFGLLSALVGRQRRAFHDYVFESAVQTVAADVTAGPALERAADFAERHRNALEARTRKLLALKHLWMWLGATLLLLEKVVAGLRSVVGRVVRWGGHRKETVGGAFSPKAAMAVATAVGLATAGAVVAAEVTRPAPATGPSTTAPTSIAGRPAPGKAQAPAAQATACTNTSMRFAVAGVPGWEPFRCEVWVPEFAGWYPDRTDFVIQSMTHPKCGWLSERELRAGAGAASPLPATEARLTAARVDDLPAVRAEGTDPIHGGPFVTWTVDLPATQDRLCFTARFDPFGVEISVTDMRRYWRRTVDAVDRLVGNLVLTR
jgi:uncharacterized RDD family membrane protein YckC